MTRLATRRRRLLRGALATAAAPLLAGCDRLSRNDAFVDAIKSAEHLSRVAQKAVTGRKAMAQEFSSTDVVTPFRANGTTMPRDANYQAMLKGQFADWKLEVAGLVARPAAYSLAELRAMPSRTQITRHDCVEGWSCIGQWKGVPLSTLLDRAGPEPEARYVMFWCADSMDSSGDSRYYESIDLDDARHPQTLMAYELNGVPLPVANGAPLRLRVERQLGYKHAKYVMRIELVESFEDLRGGKGGYWEDEGYEWYAGI